MPNRKAQEKIADSGSRAWSWRSEILDACEQATEARADFNIERLERAPDIGAVGADHRLASSLL
jgi:hypothetical protein